MSAGQVGGTAARMPAAFIGHGSPRIALQHNERTEAWAGFASSIRRPEAILVVSAHWYVNASVVTAMAEPRTIHDFYFPDREELLRFRYPAPGSPELADRMVDLVAPTWLGLDVDSWGFDHGTWSVLAHMYPAADIPVVQLSINAALPFEYHFGLGARLAPLRDEGVLIVCSGTLIHNVDAFGAAGRASGLLDRARAFEQDVAAIMTDKPAAAVGLIDHPDYLVAAPTHDHFLPLLYLAGLADAAGEVAALLPDSSPGEGTELRSYSLGLAA